MGVGAAGRRAVRPTKGTSGTSGGAVVGGAATRWSASLSGGIVEREDNDKGSGSGGTAMSVRCNGIGRAAAVGRPGEGGGVANPAVSAVIDGTGSESWWGPELGMRTNSVVGKEDVGVIVDDMSRWTGGDAVPWSGTRVVRAATGASGTVRSTTRSGSEDESTASAVGTGSDGRASVDSGMTVSGAATVAGASMPSTDGAGVRTAGNAGRVEIGRAAVR